MIAPATAAVHPNANGPAPGPAATAAKVAVVLTVHNYGRYLPQRMQSLLTQTMPHLDIVVVDDASTDDSREVAARYTGDPRVRTAWFDTRASSAYERWNDGAAMTTAPYLLFAGADDWCEPTLVEVLSGVLDAHPTVGLAYCRSWSVDEAGTRLGLTPSHRRCDRDFISTAADEIEHLIEQRTIPTASAMLIRRSVFDRCGGLDPTFRLAADHMLYARMLGESHFAYVAEPLNYFRTHDRTLRAVTPHAEVVRERYRVYGFLLERFAVTPERREYARDWLAGHWADSLIADRGDRRLARHRAIYRAARMVDPGAGARVARLWVERRFGVRLRGPMTVARYLGRRVRELRPWLASRNMLRRYGTHYRRSQQAYRRAFPDRAPVSVYDTGVRVLPATSTQTLPSSHGVAVRRVAAAAAAALDITGRCRVVPALRHLPAAFHTSRLTEVAHGQAITIQLLDPLELDGLAELCEPLLDAIETQVFGSFIVLDKVYVYRSPVSWQQPSASWLWHYDNHPREVIKAMVYLTDVDDETAPFEYLRHRATKRPVYGEPLAPGLTPSRVPQPVIDRHLSEGCEVHRVTGPRGTVVIFDDNVLHRATLARSGHRDVVVLQMRPSRQAVSPRLDPRWTGSFRNRDINWWPDDLRPHLGRGLGR